MLLPWRRSDRTVHRRSILFLDLTACKPSNLHKCLCRFGQLGIHCAEQSSIVRSESRLKGPLLRCSRSALLDIAKLLCHGRPRAPGVYAAAGDVVRRRVHAAGLQLLRSLAVEVVVVEPAGLRGAPGRGAPRRAGGAVRTCQAAVEGRGARAHGEGRRRQAEEAAAAAGGVQLRLEELRAQLRPGRRRVATTCRGQPNAEAAGARRGVTGRWPPALR
jgi:hypothetical protein